ncbi:peptidoglycan-binding protein [Dactylosporangium sp. NBC_01737]|uniref:peptidoglycan-binding domain-containing protein n=1 Tax=Dactylosporangium sp. NBC_01737 TaxID=2975959 RepID=UPI002E1297EF|nr:peptidoglycan-binding protein [Dactylosporangium sp. NBC_01737]
MSVNAPGLTQLKDYANTQLGPRMFLGIVGDANHKSGYHLGPDRIGGKPDYSIRLARDVAGARKFPNFACAYDMGMDWSASRLWLAWLVNECRSGAFEQIREIIGSLDGVHKQYWSQPGGFTTERYTGDNHISHTHISVFRDTADQDHSPILRGFIEHAKLAAPNVREFPGRLLKFNEGQPRLRGDDVRMWQARMLALGFAIDVDGIYGPKSKAVAIKFQQRHGLQVDGIVGPKTWHAAFALAVV